MQLHVTLMKQSHQPCTINSRRRNSTTPHYIKPIRSSDDTNVNFQAQDDPGEKLKRRLKSEAAPLQQAQNWVPETECRDQRRHPEQKVGVEEEEEGGKASGRGLEGEIVGGGRHRFDTTVTRICKVRHGDAFSITLPLPSLAPSICLAVSVGACVRGMSERCEGAAEPTRLTLTVMTPRNVPPLHTHSVQNRRLLSVPYCQCRDWHVLFFETFLIIIWTFERGI